MRQMTGKQSISFAKAVYIEGSAAIVGEKEKDGPLGEYFSHTLSDPMCGQESWEEGESELQLATAKLAMQKANVRPEQIRMIFAGDLLAQSIASSFGLVDLNCPLYGLFGACSTMGEALSLGAMAVAGGYGDRVLAVTSSHFGTAEKEFRFPLAYGNQRPPSASWTVTGSGACVLGKTKSRVKITGATTGKIIDYGLKDNQNMGACMAPAACDTIAQNLVDFNREPADYDRIVTGDLGVVGREILLELLKKKGAKVSMTRTGDTDVYGPNASDSQELQARVDVAEDNDADAFVSIHINSSTNKSLGGFSSYYYPKTNNDARLAQAVQDRLVKNFGLDDLGIRKANFYVNKRCSMPSTLLELAFISNPKEEKLMNSNWYINKLAKSIADGIEDYFK